MYLTKIPILKVIMHDVRKIMLLSPFVHSLKNPKSDMLIIVFIAGPHMQIVEVLCNNHGHEYRTDISAIAC